MSYCKNTLLRFSNPTPLACMAVPGRVWLFHGTEPLGRYRCGSFIPAELATQLLMLCCRFHGSTA